MATNTATVWGNWTSAQAATATSSNTTAIWQTWTTTSTATNTFAGNSYRQPDADELARHRAEREAREAEWRAASARARELLLARLTPPQRAMLEASEAFEVVAGSGRRYRIRQGTAGNVRLLRDDGMELASYCIHARTDLPAADVMLAQKLLLETDEAEFLRIANETRYGLPRQPANLAA